MIKAITITAQEYLTYSGINLDLDFAGSSDSGTSGATIFLRNTCQDVWDYLKSHFIFDENMIDFSDDFVDEYKRGLCLQVAYMLKSGDAQDNILARTDGVENLAPKARNVFRGLGLCNLQYTHDIYRRF